MEKNIYKWLVLTFYLPSGSGSARVRIWRKVKKLGMVSFRSSVYFLPFSEENHEIALWLCQEIQSAGGEATLLKVESVENLTGDEVAALFKKARDGDYSQLARKAGELMERMGASPRAGKTTVSAKGAAGMEAQAHELKSLEKRLSEIVEIDFFHAPGRGEAEEAVGRCRLALRQRHKQEEPSAPPDQPTLDVAGYRGKTWVTRPRPYVDRIATAWVIKRFIDPTARFKFAKHHETVKGAIPFDYPGAELSHQGEDCTMETVVRRFGLDDLALPALAEVVHDTDLKDSKFSRAEARGLDVVLKGLAAVSTDDHVLLEQGLSLFDALYTGLGGEAKKLHGTSKKRKSQKQAGRKQHAAAK